MPPKPKTAKQIAIEKKKILNAALQIISKKGYHNLTMRALASKCGISATKIYYYFTNKEEVYFNVVKQGFLLLHQSIKDAYCEGNNPVERFEKVCRAYFRYASENPHYYEIMFSERTPRRLDYTSGPLEEIAEQEKEVALKFYELWSRCVLELADTKGKEIDEYDIVEIFSQLHGIINLEYSNNLREVDISFEKLCDHVIEKLLKSFL